MSTGSPITEKAMELEQKGEDKIEQLADQDADSTDSNIRYMAYTNRLRTALQAASRYTAYTSDVGEAFRPVVSPLFVKAAYGVSWLYLVGDVSYETYKASHNGPTPLDVATGLGETSRLGMVAAKRGIFQAVASMALPAFTIHQTVAITSKRVFKNTLNPKVKAWGPTLSGLAVVPFLPYLFDKPVEHAVDYVFEKIEHRLTENHAAVSKASQKVENAVESVKREL